MHTRSAILKSLLQQPVVYSWLQNTRTPCFILETAVCCTARAASSRTLVEAQPQCQQQVPQQAHAAAQGLHESLQHTQKQQQQRNNSCWHPGPLQQLSLDPHQIPWSSHLQQSLQAARCFSTSSSSSQQSQDPPSQQMLHGLHPSTQQQQPQLWPDLPPRLSNNGNGYSSQQNQQQQQQTPIQGQVVVNPFNQEGYDSYGSNGFRPRSFRRREPQFQVGQWWALNKGVVAVQFVGGWVGGRLVFGGGVQLRGNGV